MDFRLSEDQVALREGVRSFCDGRFPIDALRELEKGNAFDKSLWSELAEMGVFNLRLPEAEDGVGLGTSDAVLVFVELGRRLLPGPLSWSHLAAGHIDGAATGDVVVGGIDLTVPSNEPILIEHLESLDELLVLTPDGVRRIDPKGLDAAEIGVPLDPMTPLHHVERLPAGEPLGDSKLRDRLRLEGACLTAAQLLGIAEATEEMALAYAKEREQFDRPIGSFMAIKHILSDMYVRQEVARAATYAAGATIDDPGVGDVSHAVSSAKITAGDAAHKNARSCIQVHGGMGFTWEVPAHYYLKRCIVLESHFGRDDEHEDSIAQGLGEFA